MRPMEFAEMILKMPVEMQNAFFENLKSELSEEDWKATATFISLYGLYHNPVKYEALKKAVGDTLCGEFFGHTVEPQKNIGDDPILINMYSNSIL